MNTNSDIADFMKFYNNEMTMLNKRIKAIECKDTIQKGMTSHSCKKASHPTKRKM